LIFYDGVCSRLPQTTVPAFSRLAGWNNDGGSFRGWQGKQKKGDSDRIRKNLIRFSFLGMLFCFESASKQKLLGFLKFEDFSSK